jgi:hypothetical protein
MVPVTSDSQTTPLSETVEVGVDSVDPKLRPREGHSLSEKVISFEK